MPIFSIYTESFLGISHSGEVTAAGEGTVELTDEEVQQLIDLIRENGGETDVEKLGLEEKYPKIYKSLDNVYRKAAQEAEYNHWVMAGYENGWYEVSYEEILEKCESKYGFHFDIEAEDELDEDDLIDAKMEMLDDRISDYRSEHPDEIIPFLSDVFQLSPDVDDVEYNVEIPPEIIQRAKSNQ